VAAVPPGPAPAAVNDQTRLQGREQANAVEVSVMDRLLSGSRRSGCAPLCHLHHGPDAIAELATSVEARLSESRLCDSGQVTHGEHRVSQPGWYQGYGKHRPHHHRRLGAGDRPASALSCRAAQCQLPSDSQFACSAHVIQAACAAASTREPGIPSRSGIGPEAARCGSSARLRILSTASSQP
jgi:hypothetical protein